MAQETKEAEQTVTGGRDGASLVDAHITGGNRPEETPRLLAMRQLGRRGGAVGVVLPGGLRVKRRGVGPEPVTRAGGGDRGVIQGFSMDSRRRMIGRLQSIEWDKGAVFFVTLTVDDAHVTGDWQDYKRDLANWRHKLEYHYGRRLAGGLWKLELKERQSGANVGELAPHFHIALFWRDKQGPDMASFRRWAWRSWHSRVDAVRARNTGHDRGKLLSYLSKYLGKPWLLSEDERMGTTKRGRAFDRETGEMIETGRCWGMWGDVPTKTIAELEATPEALRELCERVNARGGEVGSWYLGAISERWSGFNILGDGPDLLDSLCRGIEGLIVHPVGGGNGQK